MLHETIFSRQGTVTTRFHLHNNLLDMCIDLSRRVTLYDRKSVHHSCYNSLYEMGADLRPSWNIWWITRFFYWKIFRTWVCAFDKWWLILCCVTFNFLSRWQVNSNDWWHKLFGKISKVFCSVSNSLARLRLSKDKFFRVPPTPFIGSFPWYLSI